MNISAEQTQNVHHTTDPQQILAELKQSLSNGTVIGICAISMGPTMIMTAVDDIIEVKNDKLIVLKETDLLGIKVPEEQILLSEIAFVYPFRCRFDDPDNVQLRQKNAGFRSGIGTEF